MNTARSFTTAIKAAKANNATMHLVVIGIEVSLYVGEQFATDVVEFMPGTRAAAVSSNQFLGGDRVHFSSRDTKGDLTPSKLAEEGTVVLIISQSGQVRI